MSTEPTKRTGARWEAGSATPRAGHSAPTGLILTRSQIREVDRLAIEALGIPGVVLMENAGLNATHRLLACAHDRHGLDPGDIHAAVLCGGGNNGGDGYVIARQLHNLGATVMIYALKEPAELSGDAATNHAICAHMGLSIERVVDQSQVAAAAGRWERANVLVDALLGTGFRGEVRQPLAASIEAVNRWRQGGDRRMVMAVDIPSGLDCDKAAPSNATVAADLTVTFVAAKAGFESEAARPWLGELAVADIGAPPELVQRVLRQGG